MTDATTHSSRTASLVRTLCDAEGQDVVLRFNEPISAPTSKYTGSTYQHDTLPKATLHATIQRASVEDAGRTLMCFVKLGLDELDRVGIDPEVVYTEPVDGDPEHCIVDIIASRHWGLDEYEDLTIDEAEQALDNGREEDVLPPWDGLPTVTTRVERTEECHLRAYESDFHVQYDPPTHDIGTLIDVRLK